MCRGAGAAQDPARPASPVPGAVQPGVSPARRRGVRLPDGEPEPGHLAVFPDLDGSGSGHLRRLFRASQSPAPELGNLERTDPPGPMPTVSGRLGGAPTLATNEPAKHGMNDVPQWAWIGFASTRSILLAID